MKFHLLQQSNLYLTFHFTYLICLGSVQVHSQGTYDWYRKELSKKKENKYWATTPVDTVMRIWVDSGGTKSSENVYHGGAINLNSLRKYQTIITPGDYTIISGDVYFAGKGFSSVKVNRFNGALFLMDDSVQTGSSIIFEAVLRDKKGKTYGATGSYIVTNPARKDLPILPVDSSIIEVIEILETRFSRGIIYFTGTGFTSVETVAASEISSVKGANLISRLRPGSSVTFDNCNYWNKEKNTAITVNKTIKLK